MDWVRGEKIGHGSFATVSLAVPTRTQSRVSPPLMAVKSCGVSHSSSLASEKLILEELGDCPEIVRCFGDSFSRENGENLYNVLLEYASGGSLADKVKNAVDRRLPESEVRRYAKSVLRGLSHIHGRGYIHCDVKLQNILLCADGGARVADFGLARRAGQDGGVYPGSELRGTPLYMSPEMVAGGSQGAPADIWALGCAVAEMVGGCKAWSGYSDVAALMMRIGVGDQVPEVPEVVSEEGKDFIGKCFLKDPIQRWTAEMLLNHPFINGDDDDDESMTWLKDVGEDRRTNSPRCPFGFPDWVSVAAVGESDLLLSEEPQGSALARLGSIVCEQGPNWSFSDEWIVVR